MCSAKNLCQEDSKIGDNTYKVYKRQIFRVRNFSFFVFWYGKLLKYLGENFVLTI